ncbi:MAG: acyl-CoA thioester hydrolase, partial [Myxococcota bacterium]
MPKVLRQLPAGAERTGNDARSALRRMRSSACRSPVTGGPPDNIAPFALSVTTRGYETDHTGTIAMPIIFRFFEHKRWMMMRDPRLGIVDLVHDGHFFVVRSQAVELRRHLGQGTALTLSTRFSHVGRSTATVRHEARRTSDGVLVAQADVTGVWIAPSRRMARLPDVFRAFARAQIAEHEAAPARTEPNPAPHQGTPGSLFAPPEVVHPVRGLDITATGLEVPSGAYRHRLT